MGTGVIKDIIDGGGTKGTLIVTSNPSQDIPTGRETGTIDRIFDEGEAIIIRDVNGFEIKTLGSLPDDILNLPGKGENSRVSYEIVEVDGGELRAAELKLIEESGTTLEFDTDQLAPEIDEGYKVDYDIVEGIVMNIRNGVPGLVFDKDHKDDIVVGANTPVTIRKSAVIKADIIVQDNATLIITEQATVRGYINSDASADGSLILVIGDNDPEVDDPSLNTDIILNNLETLLIVDSRIKGDIRTTNIENITIRNSYIQGDITTNNLATLSIMNSCIKGGDIKSENDNTVIIVDNQVKGTIDVIDAIVSIIDNNDVAGICP